METIQSTPKSSQEHADPTYGYGGLFLTDIELIVGRVLTSRLSAWLSQLYVQR